MKKTYSYLECYEILGLTSNCEWSDIRRAYKVLIQKWHPDRHEGNQANKDLADKKIKSINIAHHQLSLFYRKHGSLPVIESTSSTSEQNPAKVSDSTNQSTGSYRTKKSPPPVRTFKKKIFKYSLTLSILAGIYMLSPQPSINDIVNHLVDSFSNFDAEESENYNASTPISQPESEITQPITPIATSIINIGNTENEITEDDGPPTLEATFFTYGSSMGEVAIIQGTPTKTSGNIWYYGDSEVHFRKGKVRKWIRKVEQPLKAKIKIQ